MDDHNHALAALRYLVSRLDVRHLGCTRPPREEPELPDPAQAENEANRRYWKMAEGENGWIPL